jgi:imidazolonepropionase-like amidohydrolase
MPVALHVSFPERPRVGASAYPESLMGVIAFVRQAFLDAQHDQRVARAVQANPDRSAKSIGPQHPVDDPALEALQSALDRKIPVAFEANEAREILRVLKIAREFTLDLIVTGARNAEELTADLKAQNARVIYSLNYPQRPRSLAPDADEPLRVIRQRAGAATVPAELARAGVLFAFESAGLSDPRDFVKNAAKAVKAGLSADAAIRALTVNAAIIAGAADRLGTLEAKKIANVIVTDGDLFDDGTRIKHVFVDGRPVKVDEPGARGRSDAGVRRQRQSPADVWAPTRLSTGG